MTPAVISSVIVIDFDGTLTEKDVGDEICDRFATPEWRDLDAAWVRNEISLPDAQRKMWALARTERDEALAHARTIGRFRPGLDGLIATAQDRHMRLWLASGGFDFYIEALLGERLTAFERAYFNTGRFVDGGVEIDFPHADLACAACAVCKGKVCDLARAGGARVIFVGDGSSDRCAVGRADQLFAVRGSLLERTCQERGVDYLPFDDLDEVAAALTDVTP